MAKEPLKIPGLGPEIIKTLNELDKTIAEAEAGYALLKEMGVVPTELENAMQYIRKISGALKKQMP